MEFYRIPLYPPPKNVKQFAHFYRKKPKFPPPRALAPARRSFPPAVFPLRAAVPLHDAPLRTASRTAHPARSLPERQAAPRTCRRALHFPKSGTMHDFQDTFTKAKPSFNNQIARSKAAPLEKRTLVVAVGYSLALPKGTKLACALRSSSSQKSRFAAIFGNPVAAYLRLLRKGVNVRDFYNFLQKAKPRFCLLPHTPRGRRDGRG